MTPEQSQQTQPTDVGAALRQRRMKRGQSIETVHQQTRIPKKFLEALEANQPDAFPAPVYMRSFLKGYCDYLELDFDPIWRQLAPESAGKAAPKPQAEEKAPAKGAPAKAPNRRAAPMGEKNASPLLLPLNEATMMPFLLVAGLLVAGAMTWMVKSRGPAAGAPPRASHALPALPATPDSAPVVERPAELSLDIIAAQETWIRLKADGVLRFEGRVPPGTIQNWKAKKGFELRSPEPKSLRLRLDGKDAPIEGLRRSGEGSYAIAR